MKSNEHRYLLITTKEAKFLIVADFHVGLELETFRDTGVRLDGLSTAMIEDFCALIRQNNPTAVFILGDLEHSFRQSRSTKEKGQISPFSTVGTFESRFKRRALEPLASLDQNIMLVRGNHDINSQEILPPSVRISGARGFCLNVPGRGRIGLLHGHAYPSFFSEEIILSHIHPSVQIKEEGLDVYHRLAVVLRGEISAAAYQAILGEKVPEKKRIPIATPSVRITILPSFNETIFGSPVNRQPRKIPSAFMSKLFSQVDFEVFLTDGKFLGCLSQLLSHAQVGKKPKRKRAKRS
ncbi:MAG: metallophosphoesterase [Candidatus Heimdallarchaeota archaeon]